MKAAVINPWNHITYADVPTPELEKDEVLIRVAYTGICKSDISIFTGSHPIAKAPVIAGHEFSGYVEKINSDAKLPYAVGDKVAGHITLPCGHCDACIDGHPNCCRNLRVLGTQTQGTFAEYVKLPISKVYRLPDDADLRKFALAEPLAVAMYATQEVGLRVSETVAIIGGGPIGICCGLIARTAGASKIVVFEVNHDRAASLRETFGFTVIDPTKPDAVAEAIAMTDGLGFQRIYETSASIPGFKMVTALGRVRAHAVIIGITKEPAPLDTWKMMHEEMRLTTIRVHQQYAYAAALELVKSGSLDRELMAMITDEFELADAQKAFEFCLNDTKHIKVLIKS